LVDTIKRKLELGDTQVEGPNMLANIAPSPGASIALANALRDAIKTVGFFKGAFTFNTDKWENDFASVKKQVLVA
jgi:malate dehydrogenase (quinone)